MSVFTKVFGTRSEREVKRIMPLVEKTESLRPQMQQQKEPGMQQELTCHLSRH